MKNVVYFDFENGVQLTEQEHKEDMAIDAFNKKAEKAADYFEKVAIVACGFVSLVAIAILFILAI